MGSDDLFIFGQDSVLIEWDLVGPVEFTDCRLETRLENADDIIGAYEPCMWNIRIPAPLIRIGID